MTEKKANVLTGTVIDNNHLKGDYYEIGVELPEGSTSPLPGQFYQVKLKSENRVNYNKGSFLYKPLSIFDYEDGIVTFMIKVIGEGTKAISEADSGSKIDLIGPLGNGFRIYDSEKNNGSDESVLLVSGGIGYAPLLYLQRKLQARKIACKWLHGGKTVNDIFPSDITCTDDGSEGNKGLVTNCLPVLLDRNSGNKISRIYCCGPKAMMKVVWDYAKKYGVPASFSLEEYMACGIGVCLGCAVKKNPALTADRTEYFTVCKDGPVFSGEEIDWNE